MKKIWQFLSVAIMGTAAMTVSNVAEAQDTYVSVRVEPGAAFPVGNPQDDRFTPGVSVAVKPEVSIYDIFSVGPSASVTALPSRVEGIDTAAIWTLGGFVRLKRPHGFEWNPDEGVASVSPWIDADLQYVRTGPLNRVGYAAAVGASWPVEEDRMLWIGPFLRYQGVHQADDLQVTRNTNDSHTLILGASFEIGERMTKKLVAEEEPAAPVAPPLKPQPKPTPEKPGPVFQDVSMELKQVVQFPWDSSRLDGTATKQLDEAVAKIKNAKEFKAIKIEGHASSEGQVPHNNKLAVRRAEAVLDYLISKGIPREKLSVFGFGSNVPVSSNTTEAGRVLNRRAEFVVNFVIVQEVK